MKIVNKAKISFDRLYSQAMWWTGRQSADHIRNGKVGKPGELVERMSPEEREALQQLKSDDLSSDKITDQEAALAAENANYFSWKHYTQMLKEAKLAFDTKILKQDPKADRKKY